MARILESFPNLAADISAMKHEVIGSDFLG